MMVQESYFSIIITNENMIHNNMTTLYYIKCLIDTVTMKLVILTRLSYHGKNIFIN